MILHIADDDKFIDAAIEIFENVAPGRNRYIVFLPEFQHTIKYIKNIDLVEPIPLNSVNLNKLISQITKYEFVILHNLFTYKWQIVIDSPIQVKFHWMAWGADLYILPELTKNLYLPKTKKYLFKQYNIFGRVLTYFEQNTPAIFDLYCKGRYGKHSFTYRFKEVFNRIHSISTVVETEKDILTKFFKKDILYLPFTYGNIENFSTPDLKTDKNANLIMVGNSASPTGNHIDVFELLKNNNNDIIYSPLSYGYHDYADYVEKEGKKLFKERFIAIKTFLPLGEYNKILASCGKIILAHKRQQAMGNIISALRMGSMLFLHKENPCYSFLKAKGFIIFTLEDINTNNFPFLEAMKEINKTKIEELYEPQYIKNKASNLIQQLIQ